TFGFAAYIWWCRPDIYRRLRNDLVLANLIGFVVFWAYPVAPPRMMAGFVDVVVKAGGLGAWHGASIKHADQFAAMPSMHLGYAVWCSLFFSSRSRHTRLVSDWSSDVCSSDLHTSFFQAEDGIRDWSVTGVQTC